MRLALNATSSSDTQGFASCDGCVSYFFTEANCGGSKFVSPSNTLLQEATLIGADILYPGSAVSYHRFMSVEWDGITCEGYNGGSDSVEMKSVPLSSLGLQAPFHLAR